MTVPNSQQLAEAHASGRLPIAGAHTVGARTAGRAYRSPDGAPITVTCASHTSCACTVCRYCRCWPGGSLAAAPLTTSGLSVISSLPLPASYLAFFGSILWQAFRGQSIAQPDSLSLAGFAVWVVLTGVAVIDINYGIALDYIPAHQPTESKEGIHDCGFSLSTLQ